MKGILAGLVIAFGSQAMAEDIAPAPSAVQFILDSAKHAEGGMAFNLEGKNFGAIYVPLRTLDVPYSNVIDVGAGAVTGLGTPEGLVAARINLPQIANGIFGTKWFVSHTHGPVLPTLFLGPSVKSEWPINKFTLRRDVLLEIGIPFGSVFK